MLIRLTRRRAGAPGYSRAGDRERPVAHGWTGFSSSSFTQTCAIRCPQRRDLEPNILTSTIKTQKTAGYWLVPVNLVDAIMHKHN